MGCDLDTTPLGFLPIPAAIELARLRSYGAAAVSLRPEEVARLKALQMAISFTKVTPRPPPSLAEPPSFDLDFSPLALFLCLPVEIRATLGHPAEIDRQAWQTELDWLLRRQVEQANQTQSIGLDINAHLKSGRLGAWCWRHDNGDISEVLPAIFWHSDAAPAAFRGERWFVPLVPNGTILGHQATAILRRSDVEACYTDESSEVSPSRRIDGESKTVFLLKRIDDTKKTPSAVEFRTLARAWLEPGASDAEIKKEGTLLATLWRGLRSQ